LETEYEFVVEGLQCRLLAEKPHLVLKVQPFATEQEALAYIPRLWGALAWTSVELRTGFIAETQTDVVTYYKDPLEAARNFEKSFGLSNQEPVHGMISGDVPGVIPIGKNIRTLKFGDISGTVTY
jgi:hypothetical protein